MSPLLLAALPAALAAEPVSIEVEEGPRVAVRVRAAGAPVLVPACRGVVWERFDADANRYEPITTRPCGPLSPGLTLDKEGTRFELDLDVPTAQVVRAIVVFGEGCELGQPFPLARCRTVKAVDGPTLTVRASAEP